jgi:hypothetical protein
MVGDRKGFVNVDKATTAKAAIIAAPGAGKHIEIDHYSLLADGGANTVELTFGDTTIIEADLQGNASMVFDAPEHNALSSGLNEAFNIELSAATSVVGFILYRIVGD